MGLLHHAGPAARLPSFTSLLGLGSGSRLPSHVFLRPLYELVVASGPARGLTTSSPRSPFARRLRAAPVRYTATVTPVEVAFVPDPPVLTESGLFWINTLVNVLFVVDIFFTLFTPVLRRGKPVRSMQSKMRHYAHHSFCPLHSITHRCPHSPCPLHTHIIAPARFIRTSYTGD